MVEMVQLSLELVQKGRWGLGLADKTVTSVVKGPEELRLECTAL